MVNGHAGSQCEATGTIGTEGAGGTPALPRGGSIGQPSACLVVLCGAGSPFVAAVVASQWPGRSGRTSRVGQEDPGFRGRCGDERASFDAPSFPACSFRDAYGEFDERGAVVLGVSPDTESSHARFKAKYDLPFTLLADPEHEVAERYGV